MCLLITDNRHQCRLCGSSELEEIVEFRVLARVTSDCVPFRGGGRLLSCHFCGLCQSPADEQWFEEIGEIYDNYHAYHQAGGEEQPVLDPATGSLRQRSEVLLDHFTALPHAPRSGKALDVGCGTGGTLRTLSRRGGWRLYGLEMDTKNLPFLAPIEGFENLYTGSVADLPGRFDLVTMIHALEHFPEPLATMRDLWTKIAPSGRLLVEVPNAEQNPFDYLIADHMTHFTRTSLSALAAQAGFAIDCLSDAWVTKELSLTARPDSKVSPVIRDGAALQAAARVRAQIDWLQRFVETAQNAARKSSSFGLFGTSIAATWLCGLLGDAVSFFVEEDPNRVGRPYLGRAVLSPEQIATESVVFLALVPQIADRVAARLQMGTFELVPPPPLTL